MIRWNDMVQKTLPLEGALKKGNFNKASSQKPF